jgi:hypothetical protein
MSGDRIRGFMPFGTRVRASADEQATERQLRQQMADGRRSYRYRHCPGIESDGEGPFLNLSPVSRAWVYDPLPQNLLLRGEWEPHADALTLDKRSITNLEIEVASIDAEVHRHATARQQWEFDGPVVPPDAVKGEQPPPRQRGRTAEKLPKAVEAMLADLRAGNLTPEDLNALKQKELPKKYQGKMTTLRMARTEALEKFKTKSDIPSNSAITAPSSAKRGGKYR